MSDALVFGDGYALSRPLLFPFGYRDTNTNLRTQLRRIIRRAGLTPRPKLFQNIRASRETELALVYPLHVVRAWIGNSALIANKHYLQVTEADFERGAKSDALEAQNRRNTRPHRLTRNCTEDRKRKGLASLRQVMWLYVNPC